jgi:hypothetical protein
VSRACFVGLLIAAAGCSSPPSVVLTVSADQKVDQYDLFVRDDARGDVFFNTGWTPVSPPGSPPRDLTTQKLKIALKLSRGGKFTLLLVGVEGGIVDGKPAPGATQLFWAGRADVNGAVELTAPLLTVPPGDDQDGDYWPDAQPFMMHVPAASQLYAQHTDVLDCDDKTDNPTSPVTMMAIKLKAKDINPFALENCMDKFDENCDGQIAPCVDKDGDHDFAGSDCDDNDPKRHHPTDIDPFPDPPNCCGYSLGKQNTADQGTDFLNDPGATCFAVKCMHDAVLCPMKRCGDGIDESCAGADTTCVVDDDCDGYPAPPVGNDCDDHDPNVHPNAPEPCNATKDLNCDGVIGGCVPCDLDGDGYERKDTANGCPDAKDKHPGMVDCNDYDSGVYPGSTGPCGGKEGGVSALGMITCALRGECRTVYESTGAIASGTPRVASFGAVAGDADCDGSAYVGCPNTILAGCDADGDGFPNAGAGCNPNSITVDCNDNDPTIFPGAPDKCGDGIAQDCTADTPCTMDADGDGYKKGADCDDTNPAIHPWAAEICNGIDDDCDGLTDEGNPDSNGAPMISAGAVTQCSDSNVGECAAPLGVCVCSPSAGDAYTDPNGKRTFCPTENATPKPTHPPHCFGAGQPKPQSCDALNPKDDDCDGRVDAPDGKNLAIKGQPCGVAVGQCKRGTITACDSAASNCFVQFGRLPGNDKWYVCSATAVCPVTELCNGLDDDCDGTLAGTASTPAPWPPAGPPVATIDERDHDGDGYLACETCSGQTLAPGVLGCNDCDDSNNNVHPGAKEICNGLNDSCALPWNDGVDECGVTAPTLPVCCGASGCKNTQTDFNFCNGCAAANACNPGNSDNCFAGGCRCGTGPGPCAAGVACLAGKCGQGNGAACATATDCANGHCVDNFCCAMASCGTCQACTGAGGTCVSVKNADDPDSCTGVSTCDSTGACKLKQGQPCTMGTQCASTFCVNGTCCGASSCATCTSCANGAGTCQPQAMGAQTGCNGPKACDGLGNCLAANGQGCTTGTTCASGQCTDNVCCGSASCPACQACNVGGASGMCSNQPPGPGNLCNGAGQTCDGAGHCKLSNGSACSMGTQCISNNCTDGVCCMSGPCGTCKTCNGTTPGMCQNAAVGPGNGCSGAGQACDGGGNCKQANGTACAGNNGLCATGHCTENVCCPVTSCGTCSTCNGTTPGMCTVQPIAPGNGCGGAGQTCDGAGNCKLVDGTNCTMGTQCLNGHCIDNVCCNVACNAACQRCNLGGSVGTCQTATLGTAGRGAGGCAGNIVCDGASTTCPANCTSDFTCANAFYCAVGGTCAGQVAKNTACSQTACLGGGGNCRECAGNMVCPGAKCINSTSCTTDANCATGYYCASNGQCTVEIPTGGACSAGNCNVAGCRQCQGGVACAGATC